MISVQEGVSPLWVAWNHPAQREQNMRRHGVTCQLHPISQLATACSWWCQQQFGRCRKLSQESRLTKMKLQKTPAHKKKHLTNPLIWLTMLIPFYQRAPSVPSVQQRWSNLSSLLLCSLLCLGWKSEKVWLFFKRKLNRYHGYKEYIQNIYVYI